MSLFDIILLLISALLMTYCGFRIIKHQPNKRVGKAFTVLFALAILIGGTSACSATGKSANDQSNTRSEFKDNSTTKHHSTHQASKPVAQQSTISTHASVLSKLVSYTDKSSAGPTGNYYWQVGKAHLIDFNQLSAGDARFSQDAQQRPSTARAKLTYQEYASSQGSRQGDPLEPYAWPSNNPIVAISYASTGRTYHGYLWNRSHSIGDSLLGAKSYTSSNNFTTGTRPQNVGADQNGGMRYGEETVENYWENHLGTHQTVSYQTTPIYKGDESIPRGSLVDIKSSDGELNIEVAVINDAEGIKINYRTGANNAKPYHRTSTTGYHQHHSTGNANPSASAGATTAGKWHIAQSGYVYVSQSKKYYSRVTNPGNYTYESKSSAISSGATAPIRGNEYAQP